MWKRDREFELFDGVGEGNDVGGCGEGEEYGDCEGVVFAACEVYVPSSSLLQAKRILGMKTWLRYKC